MKSFIIVMQFLTALPLPFNVEYSEKGFAKGLAYIPLVGAIIGGLLAGVYYLTSFLSYDIISVLFTVMAGVIITGGLHLDGLADAFDGLFSWRPKEKILEIMKDPRLGTFGGIALFFLLSLKIAFLICMPKMMILKALFIMPILGRLGMIWCGGTSSYARKNHGMGNAIIDFTGFREIVLNTGITVLIIYPVIGKIMIFPLLATVIFTLLFTRFVSSKIGGTTGDILGACTEMSETVVLFTLLVVNKLLSGGFLC